MIVDLERIESAPVSRADVCIVGAGAAGIALAVECARRGLSVLLLEGGGLELEPASQELYESQVDGLPHAGIHEGRFRTFGGTTTRWGGQILELDSLDFERRPWVPHTDGWPIPKSALADGYRRALEIEGVSESILRDEDVWRAVHVSPPPVGEGLESFFTRFCPQPDFGKLHRAFLESARNVTVYLHANFCGFKLTEGGDTVARAECQSFAGRAFTFSARSYVLCAGAIETARLLLQPLGGEHVAPWNESGLTGRYFQDHLDISTARLEPVNPRQFHDWFDNIYLSRFRYIPKIRLDARRQRQLHTLAVGANLHPQSVRQDTVAEFRESLLHLKRGGWRKLSGAHLRSGISAADIVLRKSWRMFRKRRAYNPDDLGIDLRVHCEQAPNPDSRVTLSEERDRFGLFRTRLDWRLGPLELATVRTFTAWAVDRFAAAGIAKATLYSDRLENLESFSRHAADTYHHMGTARMAANRNSGVVDPDCKLFGVANGFVCSSAVFPNSGFSNPTHTIIALAVRLAAHLARQT